MKTLKYISIGVGLIILTVVLAGMYKFNYLANQPEYDVDGNRIKTLSSSKPVFSLENYTVAEIFNKSCTENSDCETPATYMVRSICPYTSICLENKCAVVCPDGFLHPEETITEVPETDYVCSDDYRFNVFYDEYGHENKKIKLGKDEILLEERKGHTARAYTLTRSLTASGEKYDNEYGLTFWSKGDESFIMQDDEIIHNDCKKNPNKLPESRETLFFDPEEKVWKDHIGVCHTCTPENGFAVNGQIKDQPTAIWMKIKLKLKNDLNENPPVTEVEKLFAREYSLDPEWFGTHVVLSNDIFTIIYAASKSLEYNFREGNSALNAYYIVEEVDVN